MKMVDYWNDGNQKGLYLICDEDFTLSEYGYDLTPYYFTQDIAYTKINEINELDNYSDECYNDRNYADIQFFTLRYHTYLSFDNVGWRENGFAIVIVAKESEDSPWKIHAMYSGG